VMNAPVDAFIISTPAETHAEICTEVLSWGRPVMIEKPMALTEEEARLISEASDKTGAPFLVNHLHLFAPAYEKMRDVFLKDAPRFCHVLGRAGNQGPHRVGCAALWDYGSHDVAMCLGLGLGLTKKVSCVTGDEKSRFNTNRYNTWIDFEGGLAIISSWNDRAPKERYFEVHYDGNHMVYDDTKLDGKLQLNGQPIKISDEMPLTCSVRAFADAVKTGKTDWRFGTKLALESTKILSWAERDSEFVSEEPTV
jgi:predicted dehydrogenase